MSSINLWKCLTIVLSDNYCIISKILLKILAAFFTINFLIPKTEVFCLVDFHVLNANRCIVNSI